MIVLISQSAVVGLNLKAGPNRPDLTIIYLHWSEQKRKISACVAELKSHLVRQIQVSPLYMKLLPIHVHVQLAILSNSHTYNFTLYMYMYIDVLACDLLNHTQLGIYHLHV